MLQAHGIPIALALILLTAPSPAQYSARRSPAKVPGVASPTTTGGFLQGADNCASPHTNAGVGDVSGVPFTTGTTGTTGQNEANCYFFGTTGVDQDVWFDWTAAMTGIARLTTCGGTGVDTKIVVWPDNSPSNCPPDGTSIACGDDACGLQSTVTFDCTQGATYTFVIAVFPGASGGSGSFDMMTTPPPPCGRYDNGTTGNALGLTAGGEMGWIHRFTCVQSFNHIDTAFGTAMFPGSVTNGANASVAGWHAPAGTIDPNALGATDTLVSTVVVNGDTDILNKVDIGGTRTLGPGEVLFVMATADHVAGQFPGPLDQDNPTPEAWVVGSTLGPGTLDQDNLANNNVPPMNMTAIGFPASWLLRVTGDAPAPCGTAVCFGDGSGAACGCSNESAPGSGAGCLNTAGVGGTLTCDGTASISNDTFTLTANNVINQPGLFFQGINTIGGGTGQTFGDGVRCCGGNVVRIQVVNPPGTTSPATAQMTETATTNGPAGTIQPGDKKCYQYWHRDPAGGGVCGSSYNLTNALSVTWMP